MSVTVRHRNLFSAALCSSISAVCFAQVSYTYDNNGRLATANYGAAGSLVYGYDAAGSLVSRAAVSTTISTITSVNTASGGADIAQNTFITIKGSNLVPASTPASGVIWSTAPSFAVGQMPTQINGVSVSVNGKLAYIYFFCSAVTSPACSSDQLNVLTPLDDTTGPVSIIVTSGTSVSTPFMANMKETVPTFLLFGATNYVAATHANGNLIGPTRLYPGSSSPAQPGEPIVTYAVGFGLPQTAITASSSSQSGSLPALPVCTIGGQSAPAAFAGLISPGLYQINLTVPMTAPAGDDSMSCAYGGAETPLGDLLAIQ
jgi:uncharacterized protein (TIGR03437 family)